MNVINIYNKKGKTLQEVLESYLLENITLYY